MAKLTWKRQPHLKLEKLVQEIAPELAGKVRYLRKTGNLLRFEVLEDYVLDGRPQFKGEVLTGNLDHAQEGFRLFCPRPDGLLGRDFNLLADRYERLHPGHKLQRQEKDKVLFFRDKCISFTNELGQNFKVKPTHIATYVNTGVLNFKQQYLLKDRQRSEYACELQPSEKENNTHTVVSVERAKELDTGRVVNKKPVIWRLTCKTCGNLQEVQRRALPDRVRCRVCEPTFYELTEEDKAKRQQKVKLNRKARSERTLESHKQQFLNFVRHEGLPWQFKSLEKRGTTEMLSWEVTEEYVYEGFVYPKGLSMQKTWVDVSRAIKGNVELREKVLKRGRIIGADINYRCEQWQQKASQVENSNFGAIEFKTYPALDTYGSKFNVAYRSLAHHAPGHFPLAVQLDNLTQAINTKHDPYISPSGQPWFTIGHCNARKGLPKLSQSNGGLWFYLYKVTDSRGNLWLKPGVTGALHPDDRYNLWAKPDLNVSMEMLYAKRITDVSEKAISELLAAEAKAKNNSLYGLTPSYPVLPSGDSELQTYSPNAELYWRCEIDRWLTCPGARTL